MKLKDKYAILGEVKDIKDERVELSKDAYAVCEFIEELINKIERLRVSALLRR